MLLDFLRLGRLAEAGKPVGLRKHILRFVSLYGWLGMAEAGTDGEPMVAWSRELLRARRWWRAGHWLAHCRLRALDSRPRDVQVLDALRREFQLSDLEGEEVVMTVAAARIAAEIADLNPSHRPRSPATRLLDILHGELAAQLDRTLDVSRCPS